MLIVVDPHSGVPVYRQLMDQIRFHIASGLLKPGDELPSTRALSTELGVNPMTVSKAYSFLERSCVSSASGPRTPSRCSPRCCPERLPRPGRRKRTHEHRGVPGHPPCLSTR
jgi:DNA-binding transcriptional MocR family regulator